MENEEIIRAEDYSLTEEDNKKIEGLEKYIEEKTALCLLKYFDYEEFNKIPALRHKPLELKIFWALQRDRKLNVNNTTQCVEVLWRVKKNDTMPQLTKVVFNKKSVVFYTKEHYEGKWYDRKIKYPLENVEYNGKVIVGYYETIRKYKETIETIRKKYSIVC